MRLTVEQTKHLSDNVETFERLQIDAKTIKFSRIEMGCAMLRVEEDGTLIAIHFSRNDVAQLVKGLNKKS